MREPRPRRSPPCKQPMTTEKHGRQWRRRTNSSSRAAKLLSSCSGVPSLQPVKALLAGATTSFSEDEEELLIKLHALLGNRWSIIAGRLPGRTGEEVEAHWGTPAMRRRTGGADPDNHRVLLQALLASSHDQQGEHLPRAVPNRVRQERPGRPSSSDGDRDDDDCALSDADSRWCLAQVNLELTLSTACSTST